jgi:hypothetical protein
MTNKDTHGSEGKGWIAVDLDATLAKYDSWKGEDHIGEPVPAMLERVKNWLSEGKDVRIMTARAAPRKDRKVQLEPIRKWLKEHVGQVLPITYKKDAEMLELWDDRAIQIKPNTGQRVDGEKSMTSINELEEFSKGGPKSGKINSKKTTEKSMTSIEELEEFSKSGGLPTGEPTLGGSGAEQGGKLAGVGKTSGSGDSSSGEPINAPKAKTEKLSEDDDDVEKQLKNGKKPLEATTRKSFVTPQGQREQVAHAQAAKVSSLRKGEDDIQVGVGVAPQPVEQAPDLQKGRHWNQGEDARVFYSNQSDIEASNLVKSDDFYIQGSPSLGRNPLLSQFVQCSACETSMNKSLSACPSCGHGAIQHKIRPGVAISETQLAKSDNRPSLRPVIEKDIVLPMGLELKDEE